MVATWAVIAWACVVMAWANMIWEALMYPSVKVKGSPKLGKHSHLPQEDELDTHAEELPHWQSLLLVFVQHSFEY